MVEKLKARIEELKREKNAVILAHYYCTKEVQQVADFLGDSLALSVKAQSVSADVILFAGVHFMAETAKVLCPDKRVLIPRPDAGCSLADSCKAEELAAFKAQHPDHLVVSYVNTTVGVKALTDICCTSSNALQVVESIPASQPIIFAPDRNLGGYIKRLTGRDNILLWDGACEVHERFTVEGIRRLKAEHPEAKVVVHPECRHVEYEEHHKKGDILNLFFEEFVEDHLLQPTFVMDHPVEISPLTKRKPENPDYVERFGLFCNGWEMCNAYSELNDPIDQR
ncbi:MAG: quinolinate synthase NadA, partial [Alistipes sp.]|nr:quinolinate synthase NadA [Alistipes sp.]